MSPSIEAVGKHPDGAHEEHPDIAHQDQPSAKKQKRVHFRDDEQDLLRDLDASRQTTIPPHPLGIKPLGNAYGAVTNIKVYAGSFAMLPDELLQQLLDFLNAPALLRLGGTCKALYAFCRDDERWRSLLIENPPSTVGWLGSWRSTYLNLTDEETTSISCAGLFSDALYRPFQCAHTPLEPFAQNIPLRNCISRLADLTPEAFDSSWSDKPFILTAPVKRWPAYHTWSASHLLDLHSSTIFRAEAVDWPLSTYFSYMRRQADESPLYLFDCHFAEKMGLTASSPAYTPPHFSTHDLFTHLASDRPHHRWLILGPPRSGSTFHIDPNGTSAWNAVLRGRKYWVLFPPSAPPPGVHVAPDGATVTAPLSVAEWLLAFHAEARAAPGCVEAICHEGELLHVPAGWFHLVLNLPRVDPEQSDGPVRSDGPARSQGPATRDVPERSDKAARSHEPAQNDDPPPSIPDDDDAETNIALTHNFVPPPHLPSVLAFLRDRPEQVSGFSADVEDPYALFRERLAAGCPGVLERAERTERTGRKGRGGGSSGTGGGGSGGGGAGPGGKKGRGRWEQLAGRGDARSGDARSGDADAGGEGKGGGFSFSFSFGSGEGDEEEEEEEEDSEA